MKTTTFVRQEAESLDDISSCLEGRVFHVTKLAYLDAILSSGEIKSNRDCSLPTNFGNRSNGFFRKRNCVSLFDYRVEPTAEISDFRTRCWPFQTARDGIAILILVPEVHSDLIPWTRWKEEEAWSDQVVPYVEAGFPGSILINQIDEIICLTVKEDPNSFPAKIRNARRAAS